MLAQAESGAEFRDGRAREFCQPAVFSRKPDANTLVALWKSLAENGSWLARRLEDALKSALSPRL